MIIAFFEFVEFLLDNLGDSILLYASIVRLRKNIIQLESFFHCKSHSNEISSNFVYTHR